jgi:hypothetical protein
MCIPEQAQICLSPMSASSTHGTKQVGGHFA